jgi:hypothetical protein
MLLSDNTLPEFGVLDALVERGFGELDETFFSDLVAPSSLAAMGGRIDVIPVLGQRSRRNPADVLSKLARAYTENIAEDGSVASVMDQVRSLIERVLQTARYDAVLIDARAGLHEASAAAIIGLGAEVFLFGRDEEQTFHGYSYLLAHLNRLLEPDCARPEWIERLTPVHALASIDAATRVAFEERWAELVRRTGLLDLSSPLSEDVQPPADLQDVSWKEDVPDEAVLPDEMSLLRPVAVLRNAEYDGFDPLRRKDLLSRRVYDGVFGSLLSRIDAATDLESEEAP